MEHLINPLVKDVQISGIRKFYNMVADIEGTISLTIGQPDFPTPMHIKEAAKKPSIMIILYILTMPVIWN